MSSTPVTTIASQFLHDATEPLDKSSQVANYSDLATVPPYRGKLVHVIGEEKIFMCVGFDAHGAIWRPIISDTGTTLYLTSADGKVFEIRVVHDSENVGRLEVTYPEA